MDDQAPALADAQAASTPAVEDNSQQPSPVAEQTTSTPTEPVAQETSTEVTTDVAPAAEEPAAVEPQPSRLERRIDNLTQKREGIDNVLNNLRQFRDQASAPIPEMPLPRLSELVAGKDSIDPNELDQMGQQVAQASKVNTDLRVQQLQEQILIDRAINQAEKDVASAINSYDELKEGNPLYSEALEKKIETRYQREAFVPNPLNPTQRILNPNVKLADIAKEEVDAWRQAVELGKAQTNATLATQADTSAVTPTSDSPVEKSFEEMSLPEQEAYLRAKGHDV